METAEIQASLHSPLFSRLVEDGDRRCDLIWASPVTLHFFPLCVLKRCSPLHFERKPNLSKTLKGLLMRLVIFENTIFQLNSLNITVLVCHVSGSKVIRKERNRPSLFVWFFLSHLTKYIIIPEHLVPSCQCPIWGPKRAQEVCVDLHDHGNHNSPSHKRCSSTHTR